jgi:beta-phosphoglucomutase family hydrolase
VTGTIQWERIAAVLFDLDGVLTPTAEVHERAWAIMFDEFLGDRPAFTRTDYIAFVDGKPRYDGARSFLLSRGIVLPDGAPTDPPGDDTVCALGNRKNQLFTEVLERDGIAPYPGSVAFLDDLQRRSVHVAVVSSSRNAPDVLHASGLAPRFEVVVDGAVAAANHLPGKPAPDTYLYAATRLGVTADACIVIEDALSGVAAGRAGRFGFVLGVDRGAGEESLLANGADAVVPDLGVLVGVA